MPTTSTLSLSNSLFLLCFIFSFLTPSATAWPQWQRRTELANNQMKRHVASGTQHEQDLQRRQISGLNLPDLSSIPGLTATEIQEIQAAFAQIVATIQNLLASLESAPSGGDVTINIPAQTINIGSSSSVINLSSLLLPTPDLPAISSALGGIPGVTVPSFSVPTTTAAPTTTSTPAPAVALTSSTTAPATSTTSALATSSTPAASVPDVSSIVSSIIDSISTVTAVVPASSTSTPEEETTTSTTTIPASTSTTTNVVVVTTVVAGSTSSSTSAAAVTSTSATTTGYVFDAQASDNVAVYFGQTAVTGETSLENQCLDPDVDIVILAFVTQFFGAGGYPTVNFGAACGGQSTAQINAGATGLLYCPALAANISTCQSMGKKVLLSLGGSSASSTFSSADEATDFATTLWDLFGSGTPSDQGLRPFGSVSVDGFDLDNESNDPSYYGVFAAALRALYATATKTYYLSAAPQCPRPDASIPEDALALADFVWPQFYNNYCDIGTSYFEASVAAWAADVAANNTVGGTLLVGVLAWSGGGSGYVDEDTLTTELEAVKGDQRFGGVMLWDGSEGHANVDANGESYIAVAAASVA